MELESQFTTRILITAAAGEYDDRNSALRRHFSISEWNRPPHTHIGGYGEDMNQNAKVAVTAERQRKTRQE